MAIEKVLIINFIMDAFLLICAVRPAQLIHPGRILMAAFFGAAIASVTALINAHWTLHILSAIISAPVMLGFCLGSFEPRRLFRTGISFVAAGSIAAAFTALLPADAPLWFSLSMASVCAWALCISRTKVNSAWEAPVTVVYRGAVCRFTALIDTGNRLKEPLSGLDVMIVSSDSLSSLLPGGFDPSDPWRTLPDSFRLVSFGGVGGSGELACFMPEEMTFRLTGRIAKKADEIWIAVYPGALPGSVAALAPPSVLE